MNVPLGGVNDARVELKPTLLISQRDYSNAKEFQYFDPNHRLAVTH